MAVQTIEITTPIQPPPAVFLSELAFGMKMTQALYVVAKLGIADLLASRPRHVSQLASATKSVERSLYRVLRSLAAHIIPTQINLSILEVVKA